MTAESFDLDSRKDRYALMFDMPVKSVYFSIGDVSYALMLVTPAEMHHARRQPPRKRLGNGYPLMAALGMSPMSIDLYPKPVSGLRLEIIYDDEEHARRQKERQRPDWIREYQRYHT